MIIYYTFIYMSRKINNLKYLIKIQHPFDRALCWTSFYILIPILYTDILLLRICFFLTVLASTCHWLIYDNNLLHRLDIIIVRIILAFHILLIYNIDTFKQQLFSILFISLSISIFIHGMGIRENIMNNNKFYTIKSILPHATFRFFSFWFIMYVHNQTWSWKISFIYWLNIILFSLPCFDVKSVKVRNYLLLNKFFSLKIKYNKYIPKKIKLKNII